MRLLTVMNLSEGLVSDCRHGFAASDSVSRRRRDRRDSGGRPEGKSKAGAVARKTPLAERPFEDIARLAADVFRIDLDMSARSRLPLLLADLQAIGLNPNAAATLPLWRPSVRLVSKGSLLGALYVLEGSTLGGVQIARALKHRVGNGLGNALLFFVGREERRGAMWRELLEELESLREDDEEAMRAEDAAVTTFKSFEDWMAGWRTEVDAST